jgi:flavodoxin I
MLYDAFSDCCAKIIGFTSCEGYEFNRSKAQLDDVFVGLVLDEDCQKELSPARLNNWLSAISPAWQ